MLEMAILWLVLWFVGIWVIPYIFIGGGALLGAFLDNDWTVVVAIVSLILAFIGWIFAIYQFILQIVSVVELVT